MFEGVLICRQALTAVLDAQLRRQIILKLATQQETMLTTLERMSWLVLLLATTTFLAFIQPPGGYMSYQVLVTGPVVCKPGYKLPDTPQGDAGLMDVSQLCALFVFFFFDSLSFCLSLGCVMAIVVLSMPRMQTRDDEFEAERSWLLMLATWSLLYFVVVSGFIAFVSLAAAVFQGWHVLFIPFTFCMLLLFMGLVGMIRRFGDMFPTWPAVLKGLSFWARRPHT